MVLNLLIDNPAIRVIGPQVFPFMRVVKLVRTGVKITNSTNPITVVGNVTLTVLDCCAPPPLRLAATCAAFVASAASSAVAPNPILVGATLHFASQIYDNC
jgi:hypothetical protein